MVDTRLARDLREARGLIMAGQVLVDDQPIHQAGASIRLNAMVRLRGERIAYASRGGLKLEAALERFRVDVRERTVLDAGASTGGFTDCLLSRGAARVYAVDVGFGQLRGRLAQDPRVKNLERTNIADLTRDTFTTPISLSTIDLSYVSLTKALAQLTPLFVGPPEFVALVKPLFEGLAESDVRRPDALLAVFDSFGAGLDRLDLTLMNAMTSPVFGGRGSVEFLVHLGSPGSTPARGWRTRVENDLEALLSPRSEDAHS